ncbi:AAA family ATPase [Vreelandella aquamarina]|jgi:hypothetical protein|uniref:Predicted AAA-ATPase n=1 Tax=Vreelandella aquamarina TaxID=77097 RepID=A0A1N6DNA4_9GAMM|nr:AAA family ATPase [Halomonas meridiana]SIN63737.1 Predicted AAA-ATPase [Halomonas meridiana]SIN72289.1 Predicted AAA-ATPase [Halomonas meridiana]SIO42175.1 Predicted AAA-ATPase [Halomonas meridiana]
MPSAHRRKLPIGIQTFSDIREGNYYYVDKAPFIEKRVIVKFCVWPVRRQSCLTDRSRVRRP